jgi:hypothetical protein
LLSGSPFNIDSAGSFIVGHVFSAAGVMSMKNAPNLTTNTSNSVVHLIAAASEWVVISSFGWT